MTYLDQLRAAGKTCVLVQGSGGVGKTLLAERYLAGRFPGRLVRFNVAKEKQWVGSASGLLGTQLTDLGEESQGEFAVLCDRLRRKLETEAYGVLVDNLEPALDGKGQLIPEHRDYVELLRVLSTPSLKSFTLITSRERVSENLNIELYRLECLDVDAWRDYFDQKKLTVDASVLAEMHEAYHGNALAMKVLREQILEYYQGKIEEYWADHRTKDGLTVEQEMENLIAQQFDRLQKFNLNAYNLLCRMGCFRYQDVPTLPREGLFCLLWEVPQNQAQEAINKLRDLELVDRKDSEYRLHPLIREQAVERLRNGDDWEKSNRVAADFWTDCIDSINTRKDAIIALESYYHCMAIDDFQKAAQIIIKSRPNKWSNLHSGDLLGRSFYRLSLFDQISLIENIANVGTDDFRVVIYNILGDLHCSRGWIRTAIQYHENCRKLSKDIEYLEYMFYSDSNLAWCNIQLAEYQESMFFAECAISLIQEAENKEIDEYFLLANKVYAYLCMSFCYSCLKEFNESKKLAGYAYNLLQTHDFYIWGKGWIYLLLGLIHENLGNHDKSYEFLYETVDVLKDSHYTQLEARAIIGLAKLDRIHHKFDEALSKHNQSIKTLDDMKAECDLAEAYYQRALTYQKMGDDRAQADFDQALKLWSPDQIDAPKQIERVRNAMNNPPQ